MLNYTEFKAICDSKSLWTTVQYNTFVVQSKNYYKLRAYDEPEIYLCDIEGEDASDFELNYKASSNATISKKNIDGFNLVSQTFEDVQGLYPKKKMFKEGVTGGVINFFDHEVLNKKNICGGEYWIGVEDTSKVNKDDYVEFSVIDKNDILGMFSTYGLTVGVDVLELTKFVNTDYVKKGNNLAGFNSQLFEGIKGTNRLIPGLFLRIAYFSFGTENLEFLWRLYYYE